MRGLPATGTIALHSAEPVQAALAQTTDETTSQPTGHKNRVIVDNNDETATKSMFLWKN